MIGLLLGGAALGADVVTGANLLGAGGVGVAASRDNAGITLNPGLLALHERYDFSGLFRYGPNRGIGWGATAMDARTSEHVAAGFAYGGGRIEPPLRPNELPGWAEPGEDIANQQRTHDFTGAIAIPLLDRKIGLGFAVDVGLFDTDRHGKGTLVDGHLGLGVRPIDVLTFGLSGRNLIPAGELDRPAEVLGGVRFEAPGVPVGALAVEVDGGWRDRSSSPLLAAGLDVTVAGNGALRGGWRLEDQVHSATFGIGYTDEAGSIEYGLVVPLPLGAGENLRFDHTIHQVSIRFSAPPDGIEEP